MTRTLFALGAAAIALASVPADARHYSNVVACSGWRGNTCVAWNRLTLKQARKIQVGTVFGPNYTYYTPFSSIPQAIVTQYDLTGNYRYVTADGYVYVVDPNTYAVIKVIAPTP